jgi:hypothetical protein
MLYYIVFTYVYDVALEVFHALGTGDAVVGNRVHWGTGTGARWGMEDKGAVDAIPFRFIPIQFLFALRGGHVRTLG